MKNNMKNNQEKKTEQAEKQTQMKDDTVLEMICGGLIRQEDGTYFCTRCRKTVNYDHSCSRIIVN